MRERETRGGAESSKPELWQCEHDPSVYNVHVSKVVAAIAMVAMVSCARPEYSVLGGMGTTAGAIVLANDTDSLAQTAIGGALIAAGLGVIIYGMTLEPRGMYPSRNSQTAGNSAPIKRRWTHERGRE